MVHCQHHWSFAMRQMDVMALLAVLVRHAKTLLRLAQATPARAQLA